MNVSGDVENIPFGRCVIAAAVVGSLPAGIQLDGAGIGGLIIECSDLGGISGKRREELCARVGGGNKHREAAESEKAGLNGGVIGRTGPFSAVGVCRAGENRVEGERQIAADGNGDGRG